MDREIRFSSSPAYKVFYSFILGRKVGFKAATFFILKNVKEYRSKQNVANPY